jgi:hypothetical protein
MLKRIVLASVFVAAFGMAGLGIGKKAMAWHCDDGYSYGYPAYYSYYAPRTVYYRSYPAYYRGFYGGDRHRHHGHHHHGRSGVSVSFGF